jgi:hypothetical protein
MAISPVEGLRSRQPAGCYLFLLLRIILGFGPGGAILLSRPGQRCGSPRTRRQAGLGRGFDGRRLMPRLVSIRER